MPLLLTPRHQAQPGSEVSVPPSLQRGPLQDPPPPGPDAHPDLLEDEVGEIPPRSSHLQGGKEQYAALAGAAGPHAKLRVWAVRDRHLAQPKEGQ